MPSDVTEDVIRAVALPLGFVDVKVCAVDETWSGLKLVIRARSESCQPQMKTRCFDHIDLRVKDMGVAKRFYAKFLPELGFVHESPGEDFHTFYSAGGDKPSEFFGFTEDKNHQPNGTRIAFWTDTREEVDSMAQLVQKAGAKNLEGPEVCVDYSPGYYAFFFEDPDGNKLEICCRESPIIAE